MGLDLSDLDAARIFCERLPAEDVTAVTDVLSALWREADRSQESRAATLNRIAADLQRRMLNVKHDRLRARVLSGPGTIGAAGYRILSILLHEHGPLRRGELADYLGGTPEETDVVIERMSGKGLLEVAEDGTVLVTDAGRLEHLNRVAYGPALADLPS